MYYYVFLIIYIIFGDNGKTEILNEIYENFPCEWCFHGCYRIIDAWIYVGKINIRDALSHLETAEITQRDFLSSSKPITELENFLHFQRVSQLGKRYGPLSVRLTWVRQRRLN